MAIIRRQRVTDHQEVDSEGSWAISYGDMITLLLTFFILFFSTNPEKDRLEHMDSLLLSKLKGEGEQKQKGEAGDQAGIKTEGKEPGQGQKGTEGSTESKAGRDPAMDEKVKKDLDAQVHKVGNRMLVEFPGTSFFDLGETTLTKVGEEQLKQFVVRFMPFAGNYLIGIRAYTDNKQVRKDARRYKDNLELSALRAVATMRSLQHFGIPLNRMRLGGFGELRLTAEELQRAIASTPEYPHKGLALARKVVLVIEPDIEEAL